MKLGFRALLASPASTAIVVLTLGLGIGANTAIFSLVDALVLRPFPIPDIDRLVMLWGTVPAQGEERDRASPADFLDWTDQTTVFENLVAMEWWDVNLSGTGEPERLQGTFVSPDYLETLGVEPHLGRTLSADAEEYAARTVVLSYQLYQRRFGGDPGIVGKTIRLDGEQYEVVGVAREGFDYPYGSELWVPLWLDAETAARRDVHYLNVIGKLRPGVSLEGAQAELDLVTRRLQKEHPLTNDGRGGSESRSRQRGRRLLVMGEVAIALVLLIASGLSIRGTLRLANGNHGYDPDGLMTFEIVLPDRKYDDPEMLRQFYGAVLDGVRGTPGVLSADLAIVLPSSGNNYTRSIDVEENRVPNLPDRPLAHFRVITPGYFETMRIPLLAGRAFGSGDGEDTAPVAIVSRKFAERSWPSADPLGRRFREKDDDPWLTVVGVSGDVLHDWFLKEPQPTYYVPFEQRPRAGMSLAVRTLGEPEAVTAAVRSHVRRADPDQPIFHASTMRQLISERITGLRYAALIMGVLGFIGLVLSAVGIYGLMMYSVSRRTHEIGVRVALGAERADVLRLALGQAISITVAGVAIGLVLAYAAARLMASNLFGVVRLEAATFVALAAVLSAVSLLAAYLPARRALAVDPAVALRAE